MAEIWNLNAICRCCHKDGYFRSMQYPYVEDGDVEVYSSWMKEVFGIIMVKPPVQASEMICDMCITILRDARTFKKQVTECELRFQQYCRNEANFKIEPDQNAQSESKLQGFDITDNDFLPKEEFKIKIEPDNETLANETGENYIDKFDNNCDFHNDSDLEPLAKKESHRKGKKKASNLVRTATKRIVKKVEVKKARATKTAKRKTINSEETKDTNKNQVKTKSKRNKPKTRPAIKTTMSKIARTDQNAPSQIVRCKQCGMYVRDFLALFEHKDEVHKGEQRISTMDIKCVFCKETIRGIIQYKSHVHNFHPGNGRVCNFCPEIFRRLEHMKEHMEIAHKNLQMYECDYCNKKFHDKHGITNHIKLEMNAITGKLTNATCDICGLHFHNKSNLKYHIIRVHENIRAFNCQYCDKSFKSNFALTEHTNSKHTFYKPHVCPQCDKAFLNRQAMLKHFDNKHSDKARKIVKKDGEVIPLWKKIYKCFVCKEPFQGRTVYRKHLRKEHDGVMPYQCHICAKSFTTNFCLLRHLYTHDDTNMVRCEICFKQFKHELFLKAHNKRTHSNKNRDGTDKVAKGDQVKCDLCNRYVQHLDKHRKVHFNRPYKCTLCFREYSLRASLKRHMNDHLKLMVFSCDICDAKFMKKNSIVGHKKRKHPEVVQRYFNKDDNGNQGGGHQGDVNQRDMKCEPKGDAT